MRAKPTRDTEKQVLVASARRCCLCYYLAGDKRLRRGQIAHLQQDPSASGFDDLVWLCLEHHDEFDSSTRQSKNFTRDEVRYYRDRLHQELGHGAAEISLRREHSVLDSDIPQSLVAILESAGGTLDYLATAWRPMVWSDKARRDLFAYKSPNRFDGICRIECIPLRDVRTVILCEAVKENPGMSITNAVEEIALQVCISYRVEPSSLVWIEHYPREAEYLMVDFKIYPPEGMFAHPSWTPMTSSDWRSLGLRPRGQRSRRDAARHGHS